MAQTKRNAELYDPATGRWSPTGSLNNNIVFGNHAALLPDGKVLFLGIKDYDSNTPPLLSYMIPVQEAGVLRPALVLFKSPTRSHHCRMARYW